MIKKILVPMDGSRQSAKALEWAIDIAGKYHASLLILRVVTVSMLDTAWSTAVSGGPVIRKKYLEEAELRDKRTMAAVRQYCAGQVKKAGDRGIKAAYCVKAGDPAESIQTCAKQEDIDIIVMNSNGKGWLRRAIMGSVTESVIRNSKVPVLVIRPESRKKRK
ncbi:MAG: universal stress protein [Dehalococcoidales bacterium]|jgi:nucleotide-binding universal stress UspA family protein|nr:universal stress protein [Dehalococcoidales bacterium]